jgi:RNA polymerase sigma-70 factor (ECF subfamily)
MSSARVARPSLQAVKTRPDFDSLFRNEFDYVWFSLRRLGVHNNDLEDVTHDVFILVYQQLDHYDPERPLRPWLFGFAYWVASDYRRLARHRVEARGDLWETVDPAPSTIDQVAARQSLELAWKAIGELDLDRRAVFLLHEVEGYAMPEIASALQIPLNTAYSRLRLARADFAKVIARHRRGLS